MYNTIYQCLSNPVVYFRWQVVQEVSRKAARAAQFAALAAGNLYIETDRLFVNGKVNKRHLQLLANAAQNKRNLDMLSNAASTASRVADDKDSRKDDSPT